MRGKNGITLIVLVITIIVILILAGIVISAIVGNDGLMNKATEGSFKSEVSEIIDAWDKTLVDRIREGEDETLIELIEDAEKRNVLKDISPEMLAKLEVQNGKLVYIENMCTDEEKQWFEELGIYSNYSIEAEVTSILKTKSEGVSITVNQGYDLVLILDISGSMGTSTATGTRLKDMVKVVNNIINEVMKNELNRISIVVFSSASYTKVLFPLDRYTTTDTKGYIYIEGNYLYISSGVKNSKDKDRSVFASSVSSYRVATDGGTYTQLGIKTGATVLIDVARGTTPSEEKYEKNSPGIILLTDGEPQTGTTTYTNPTSSNTNSLNTANYAYYTILTANYYKRQVNEAYKSKNKSLMFFTVGVGMSQSSYYQLLLLDPNDTNVANTLIKGDQTAKTLCNSLKSASNPYNDEIGFAYADGSSLGSFDATQLQAVFEEYIEKLSKSYEIPVDSKGMYETVLTVETDEKELIDVEIDESEPIKVSVTAALIENKRKENGKIKYDKVSISGVTTEITKDDTYKLSEIKSGINPNLKYSNGKIVWYLRREYSNAAGLAAQAIEEVTGKVGSHINVNSRTVEIINVTFEYYVKEKTY